MPSVSADNRLRDLCLKQEGTILLVDPGLQDRVIRVLPLPEAAETQRLAAEKRFGKGSRPCVYLDLSNGPDQELWRQIERSIHLLAPRDRAVPAPKMTAEEPGKPWNLTPEEVPVVRLGGEAPKDSNTTYLSPDDPAKPGMVPMLDAVAANVAPPKKTRATAPKLPCDKCTLSFKGDYGLKVHKRRAHKE